MHVAVHADRYQRQEHALQLEVQTPYELASFLMAEKVFAGENPPASVSYHIENGETVGHRPGSGPFVMGRLLNEHWEQPQCGAFDHHHKS